MQVENKQTISGEELNSDHDPLRFACHPLGKLDFLAGTITSLCDLAGEPFAGFDSFTIISMGEIISDATQELYAITNAATARIDALKAQLRVCGAVASSSPVKTDKENAK